MEVSMTEVMVLQHIRCETLGLIEEELINSVIKPRIVRIFDGEPVPKDIEGYGGLIVMGGPMGVYEQERYPFLVDEMRLMECAMNKKKPVKLSEYKRYPFLVPRIDLDFRINKEDVIVSSSLFIDK